MAPAQKRPDTKSYAGRLAARIRELREDAGLTVEELAERITKAGYQTAVSTLYGWENGNRSPALEAIPAITKALRLASVHDLMPAK